MPTPNWSRGMWSWAKSRKDGVQQGEGGRARPGAHVHGQPERVGTRAGFLGFDRVVAVAKAGRDFHRAVHAPDLVKVPEELGHGRR